MSELLPDLLARCRAGDRSAFDTLVRRFYPYALSLAASLLPNRDLADDAVQSAFVTLLPKLDDLRTPDAFPGWFRQIVRTECNRLLRRKSPTALDGDPPTEANDAVAREELRGQVRAAIATLPPTQRQAVELFYLDELSQADVAKALDIPEGTVKRRLHDARVNLRTKLKSQLPI